MTLSNGNIFRITGLLCGEFTGQRWIPRTKANDAELWFFSIYAWINGWVENREAFDLRRYRDHYDVIVMLMSVTMTGRWILISQFSWVYNWRNINKWISEFGSPISVPNRLFCDLKTMLHKLPSKLCWVIPYMMSGIRSRTKRKIVLPGNVYYWSVRKLCCEKLYMACIMIASCLILYFNIIVKCKLYWDIIFLFTHVS